MAYEEIAVEDLMPPLVPVRRVADDGQMQELVQSIATTGLLQPLVVAPEDDGYRILAGHRRFLAIQALDWEEVPCNIMEVDRREQANITISENLIREDVNEVDMGWYLRHLVERYGYTQAEVGERLGRSQAWVSYRITLTRLPDQVQAAIQQGKLGWMAALDLRRIENEETRNNYTRNAINRQLNDAEVKSQVDAYKRYEQQIETGVEVARETRTQEHVESNPLRCQWCDSLARDVPGEMVWLCGRCLRALLESRQRERVEGGKEGAPAP